jgi:hypothetical protein
MTDLARQAATSNIPGQDQWQSARVVAIVVHGVGDHSPTDLLAELTTGLNAMQREDVRVNRYEGADFPLPNGDAGPQDILRIDSNNGTSFVVPVVWSDVRLRAAASLRTFGPPDDFGSSIPLIQVIVHLIAAIPALILLPIHTLCCVPKARGVWKAVLILLAGVLVCLVTGLVWVIFKIFTLPLIPSVPGPIPGIEPYPNFLIAFLYGLGMMGLLQLFLPVLDYAGDVAAYIGLQKRRNVLETRMADIIQFVLRIAPRADCLVVGHSLGSVLVSHALLQQREWNIGERRMFLLTLGSPLRMLTRIFTSRVDPPAQLASAYSKKGPISSWVNAWRSWDVIGRSLGVKADNFSESELGRGGHTGYWQDSRAWRLVVCMLGLTR